MMVLLWLAAVTAANLITAKYGPAASIYCAFALIAVTLVVRDTLHERWTSGRWWKMGALILTGGALAWLASPDAGRIGLASCIAFAAAESVDAIVFEVGPRRWLERSNLSNVAGAAVDSLVFPWLAFGGVLWAVTFGQFTAKVAGGLLLTLVVVKRRAAARHEVAA